MLCDKCKAEIPQQYAPEMQCPKCHTTAMKLERFVGWICVNCDAGPYLVHTTGLIPANHTQRDDK